jgi:hypothetical protein
MAPRRIGVEWNQKASAYFVGYCVSVLVRSTMQCSALLRKSLPRYGLISSPTASSGTTPIAGRRHQSAVSMRHQHRDRHALKQVATNAPDHGIT